MTVQEFIAEKRELEMVRLFACSSIIVHVCGRCGRRYATYGGEPKGWTRVGNDTRCDRARCRA